MSWRGFLLLGLLSIFGFPVSAGVPIDPQPRIALGSFGKEVFGEWFRLLVEASLIRQGFKVVSMTDTPDAILNGVILSVSVNAYPDGLIRLALADGTVTWRWEPSGSWGDHSSRPVAERFVKALIQVIEDGTAFPKAKPITSATPTKS